MRIVSDNVSGADNQQGSPEAHKPYVLGDPSETTRRAPLTRKIIIAYLNGAAHDASLNKGKRVRFAQKDKRWLLTLQELLTIIGRQGWIYREGKTREVFILETLCPEIDFDFDPLPLSSKERAAYLRGFFDAEGGVPRNGKRFYIQLSQKNRSKMETIQLLLKELGIDSGKLHNPSKEVDPNYWRIFIRARAHEKFAETVNSLHPVKKAIFLERMKI